MKASWLPALLLAFSICLCVTSPLHAQTVNSPESLPRQEVRPAGDLMPGPGSMAPSVVVAIPGPVRSLLRMAGVSQDIAPEEVLPLVARNIMLRGYMAGKPTEYLILMKRYVQQAHELISLAGPEGAITVPDCAASRRLLGILGYQLREGCGPSAAVQTDDPERAFVTVDSGFPLAELEEALRDGKPFVYPFSLTRLPALSAEGDWTVLDEDQKYASAGLLEALLGSPSTARLYWALSRMDSETRMALGQSPGLPKLAAYTAALDFYGGQILIRSGKVVVPGGTAAESAWADVVGADPKRPSAFVVALLDRNEGALAAYYDALSRVNRTQQAYFCDPHRLRIFYEAFRDAKTSRSLAKTIFAPYPGLLLLMSRTRIDADGQPHVPGNLDVWKEIVRQKSSSAVVRQWAGRASRWNNSQQLLESMFAFARIFPSEGPLDTYLALNEMDRDRADDQRLTPATVRLLASRFDRFSSQYSIFSEFDNLDNASITRFINVAVGLDRIKDRLLRADALGILQAQMGLWQILARQGQIRTAVWNDSWQKVIAPFATVSSATQLFDAGRTSLQELMAATANPGISQGEFLALLAGPEQPTPEGQQVRQFLASRMRLVLDDQRLVSFDTLFALGDGLARRSRGENVPAGLIERAAELRSFEMPRPLFSNRERTEYSAGFMNNRHSALELRTDMAAILKSQSLPKELLAARGKLAPFLRDTLVGLNYAYYEPPGSHMLHSNSLFVRSQDFSGQTTASGAQAWDSPRLAGRGWTTGGGAYLSGSLSDLPYALARVEQDFIVPNKVQALIWEDLVPSLLTGAILPRWWHVTPDELHAVALYQRAGEELLATAARDQQLHATIMDILSECLLPQRLADIEGAIRSDRVADAVALTTPADTFFLAAEFRRRFPQIDEHSGPVVKELDDLARRNATAVDLARIAEDFGVPHPALARTYDRDLLNGKPFPAFLGYSSQLMAESWESNNLYWGRLADELGYAPVMLNRLVPELTYRMVEQISATHFEDWPALLRAMRETGAEFRNGKVAALQRKQPVAAP